jgi:hypothetical protein
MLRALVNWWKYRRWTPCPHRETREGTVSRAMGPGIPRTMQPEVWIQCTDCGTFLHASKRRAEEAE